MTELIWEGKYKDGKKVSPLRVALPFQTVETVNETAQERQKSLHLFHEGKPGEWRNRLIWGDKKYVLPSLLPEFAGKVNLIYIDPPFNVGADFSFTATLPDLPDTPEDDSLSFTKEPSLIEQKAYRDTWGRGLDSYLQWFYETVVLLHELLAEDGSIYVHLDWHVGHYAKVVLDEVFGADNFLNEIVWKRYAAHSLSVQRYDNISDHIFLYAKDSSIVRLKPQRQKLSPEEIEKRFPYIEPETGRRFQHVALEQTSNRSSRGETRIIQGREVTSSIGWRWSQETFDKRLSENPYLIYWTKDGRPRYKIYADEYEGRPLGNIWDDIPYLSAGDSERLAYDTQKPEALLERIIRASTRDPSETYEPDLVLDCFVGSGTTAVVAEKLGRRWIACDLSRFAIHTTRKRLLQIPGVRPFVVQNLGKYERQVWQVGEFGRGDGADGAAARQRAYIEFILKLYNARPVKGYTWLHGVKAGRMVHVGSVDAPISLGDVTQIAAEFRKAIGTGKDAPTTNGVDILGWDFAFEINEVAKQQAIAAGLDVRFLRIPRDVMDKRAVEQGDIHFFELAALSVEVKVEGRKVTLQLTDFVIPPDDVPEEVRGKVKHWSQWIDYWAVDWDFKGDAFHNQWQSYRTRKNRQLELQAVNLYEEPGNYTIVVKVIDILGNDTTKTLTVRVA